MAGKDIYRESVVKLVEAVGIKPKQELVDLIMSMRFRNKLVYVVAVNYLVSVGLEPSVDNVISVIKAMEVMPDAVVAQQAIDYYSSRESGG